MLSCLVSDILGDRVDAKAASDFGEYTLLEVCESEVSYCAQSYTMLLVTVLTNSLSRILNEVSSTLLADLSADNALNQSDIPVPITTVLTAKLGSIPVPILEEETVHLIADMGAVSVDLVMARNGDENFCERDLSSEGSSLEKLSSMRALLRERQIKRAISFLLDSISLYSQWVVSLALSQLLPFFTTLGLRPEVLKHHFGGLVHRHGLLLPHMLLVLHSNIEGTFSSSRENLMFDRLIASIHDENLLLESRAHAIQLILSFPTRGESLEKKLSSRSASLHPSIFEPLVIVEDLLVLHTHYCSAEDSPSMSETRHESTPGNVYSTSRRHSHAICLT